MKGRVCEVRLGGKGGSSYDLWKGWEGNEKLTVQASSQIIGPPGTDFNLKETEKPIHSSGIIVTKIIVAKKEERNHVAVKSYIAKRFYFFGEGLCPPPKITQGLGISF